MTKKYLRGLRNLIYELRFHQKQHTWW